MKKWNTGKMERGLINKEVNQRRVNLVQHVNTPTIRMWINGLFGTSDSDTKDSAKVECGCMPTAPVAYARGRLYTVVLTRNKWRHSLASAPGLCIHAIAIAISSGRHINSRTKSQDIEIRFTPHGMCWCLKRLLSYRVWHYVAHIGNKACSDR